MFLNELVGTETPSFTFVRVFFFIITETRGREAPCAERVGVNTSTICDIL